MFIYIYFFNLTKLNLIYFLIYILFLIDTLIFYSFLFLLTKPHI